MDSKSTTQQEIYQLEISLEFTVEFAADGESGNFYVLNSQQNSDQSAIRVKFNSAGFSINELLGDSVKSNQLLVEIRRYMLLETGE